MRPTIFHGIFPYVLHVMRSNEIQHQVRECVGTYCFIWCARKKQRWLWYCHRCELWCCFIFELVQVDMQSQTCITRVKGPQRLLPTFVCEHLEWARISWPTPISLNGQALKFLTKLIENIHGWHGYPPPLYDRVDCRSKKVENDI